MFTIRVIDQNTGKPISGKKVQVLFDGFWRGSTRSQYTDDDGETHFDYDNGDGKVYVGSEVVYEGYISGRKIVYI